MPAGLFRQARGRHGTRKALTPCWASTSAWWETRCAPLPCTDPLRLPVQRGPSAAVCCLGAPMRSSPQGGEVLSPGSDCKGHPLIPGPVPQAVAGSARGRAGRGGSAPWRARPGLSPRPRHTRPAPAPEVRARPQPRLRAPCLPRRSNTPPRPCAGAGRATGRWTGGLPPPTAAPEGPAPLWTLCDRS